MKWKPLTKQKPLLGETRTVIRFAFLPTKTEECVVWLEKYKAHQEYDLRRDTMKPYHLYGTWITRRKECI